MPRSLSPLETREPEIQANYDLAESALDELAAQWLDTKAAGRDTSHIDSRIAEESQNFKRAQGKLVTVEERKN